MLDVKDWVNIIGLVASLVLIPLLSALYRSYKTMREDVSKAMTLLENMKETVNRIEERQYDRRKNHTAVDDERRNGNERRRTLA